MIKNRIVNITNPLMYRLNSSSKELIKLKSGMHKPKDAAIAIILTHISRMLNLNEIITATFNEVYPWCNSNICSYLCFGIK